jgi:hypothetical protein
MYIGVHCSATILLREEKYKKRIKTRFWDCFNRLKISLSQTINHFSLFFWSNSFSFDEQSPAKAAATAAAGGEAKTTAKTPRTAGKRPRPKYYTLEEDDEYT